MKKEEGNQKSELACKVCEHEHKEDGTCDCGCEVEQQMDTICWSCGHAMHNERDCKCGCTG